jgi:hypothetical protein
MARNNVPYAYLRICLSEAEDKMMKRRARKRGLSVPAYIRYLINRKKGSAIPAKKGRSAGSVLGEILKAGMPRRRQGGDKNFS